MSDARPFVVAALFFGLLLGGCTSSSDGLTLGASDAGPAARRDGTPPRVVDLPGSDAEPAGPGARPDASGAGASDARAAARLDASALDAPGVNPRVDASGSASRRDAAAAEVPPAPPSVAAPPQCARDADCQLVNDCCSCVAVPRMDRAPACDSRIACAQTFCMQFGGIDQPRCVAGRCVLGLDCDATVVACKRLAPTCPAGQVPRIVGGLGARCYGECVDARQCLSVPSCAGCAKDELCVRGTDANGATTQHCVPGVRP
jgi:hypothetical protein